MSQLGAPAEGRPIKRLGFAFNPTRAQAVELRDRALAWCEAGGLSAWALESNDQAGLVERLPETDCLVVLGGDGTFLRAARALAVVDTPVLGVNSGRVGFLSKAEADALQPTLALLRDGRYRFESRMMLEARLEGSSFSEPMAALNDAAVVRGSQVRVVHIEVTVGGSHVATWIADGVVVATPTGSTAYSFSAGGPILDPTARNLILTPIAAYLSAVRSIVVGPQHTVRLRIIDGADSKVSIDGREDHALTVGDTVEVRALERPLRLIEPVGAPDFWELLRRKAALLPR
jgi:NAD+ kinase